MGLFSKKKEEDIKTESFSGWRVNMPKNINLPQIQNTNKRLGLIPFGYTGSDMLFPQVIEQSEYEAVPSHTSCLNLAIKSAIGAGYIFENYEKLSTEDKLNISIFEENIKLKKFVKQITKDFRLHNRINIMVTKKSNGKLVFERISPAKVGYNTDKSKYFVSNDFLMGAPTYTYDAYENGCKPGVYMIDFDGISDKYAPYPVPEWLSGLKQIKLNSIIPDFHEANMENSVNVGLVIKKPTAFKDNEKSSWLRDLFGRKGVDKTGQVLVFSAPSKEMLPDIQQLEVAKNDEMFKVLRESTIDDICMAHSVNPILIGVKTPGSLGANEETITNYNLFYTVVVVDIIEHIEDTINKLIFMSNMNVKFKLKENKIYTV